MTGIFVVLGLVILIMICVFFEAMASLGAAGYSPSKLISELLKKKSDKIDNSLTKTPVPLSDEVTTDDSSKKITEPALNRSIMRWRIAAGILLSASMLFFFDFFSLTDRTPLVETYPWKYVFLVVLIVTIFVFVMLWKKERQSKQ